MILISLIIIAKFILYHNKNLDVYKRKVLGTILMAIVGAVVDYYIVFPLYGLVMPIDVYKRQQ